MFRQAFSLLLVSSLILGINCSIFSRNDFPYDLDSLPSQRAQNPFVLGSWNVKRADDASPERDREELGPDYRDPDSKGSEQVPSVEKPNNARPQSPLFPGGVIDVDAGGLDFPSGFPDLPEAFGFGGAFGSHPDGSLLGLGGFFGGPDFKPWWKGENVCIEREETNEEDSDEDEEADEKALQEDAKNDTKKEPTSPTVPNFFSTAISLSNCHQTPTKYECVTKINNHGVVKTLTVRYKCCYGFERTEGTLGGCMKKLDLKSLLDTVEDTNGKEFRKMIASANLEERLGKENLTIFVPTDNALNEFTERMLEMNKIELSEPIRRKRQAKNAVTSEQLILNHVTKGFVDLNDLDNEQLLKSENNDGSIRINLYPTPNYQRMLTANCAKVTKGNNLAKNGIVHVVEGVVVPALQSIQDVIGDSTKLTSLKKMMDSTEFTKLLKDDGHYTIFAPTDDAFNKLDESTRQKLLNGDSCALSVLRHHVVAHTVCSAAVIGNATTHNIDGELINMERKDNDEIVVEELAKMTQADVMATNGVIHLVDTLLIPESAQYINQALKTHNLTKFQNLIEQAGLIDDVNNYKNATVFAPSDKAFEDSETVEFLDSIKDDKAKLKQFLDYHTVEGQLQSCDLSDDQLIKTNDQGKTLRINLYSTVPIFSNVINAATVNCARIKNYDEKACGSVIHEVDKILVPPSRSVLEIVKNNGNFSTLMKILNGTEVEKILEDEKNSITLLAPDNEAFSKVSEEDMKILTEDKEKANAVMKNHVLSDVLCCSGVGPQPWGFNNFVRTLSHQVQQLSRRGDHNIRIGRATVTKCDSMATNGIIHSVDKVLFPHRRQEPAFGFFFFDI